MKATHQRESDSAGRHRVARTALGCVFFGLFYIWVWQFVQPQLLYHSNQVFLCEDVLISFPLFYKGWVFFEPFATTAGGLAEYAGAFLSQYFYYGHIGALILTGIAWLAYVATDRLIAAVGGRGVARWLRFVTPLLLLVNFNRYTFHVEDQLVFLTSLAMSLAYVLFVVRWRNRLVPLLVFAAASAIAYYVAGPPAVALAAVLCGLFEFLGNRRPVLAFIYLLAAWAAARLLETGPMEIRAGFDDWWAGVPLEFDAMAAAATAVMYLFLALLVAVLAGRRWSTDPGEAQEGKSVKPQRRNRLAVALALVLLAVGSGAVAFGTHYRSANQLLRITYFARIGGWSQVTDSASRVGNDCPIYVAVEVNRALFHTGRLLDEMFRYHQDSWRHLKHPWVLIPQQAEGSKYRGSYELLLRLGCLNEAEYAAHEALQIMDPRPRVLQELAFINLVKRQPEAARVYLTALSKDVVHGRFACDYLRRMDDDPMLTSDKDITQWRSRVSSQEVMMPLREDRMLKRQLAADKNNRMAFEFLMAGCLITRSLPDVVANVQRLNDFGYERLPRHIAEAIEIYSVKTGRQPDLHGFEIDQKTVDLVERATQITLEYGHDSDALVEAMQRELAGTYCAYFIANISGAVQ